jgi:hypothetical protein
VAKKSWLPGQALLIPVAIFPPEGTGIFLFYVQDVRYAAGAGTMYRMYKCRERPGMAGTTARSGDAQDGLMPRSGDAQNSGTPRKQHL